MNSTDYMDKIPYEIHNSLPNKGEYYCSVRTICRIISENKIVRERRKIKMNEAYKESELLAIKPNEVWSWNITKLRSPRI